MAQPYYSDQLLQALVFLGEPVFGEPGSTRSVPGKLGSRPDAKPAAKATTGTKPDRTVTGKGRGTVPISYDQRATLAPISVRVREVRRRYEAPELRPRVIDQLARRGTSGVEIGSQAGECRMVRHGFLVRFLWRHLSSEATLVFKSVHGCSKMYPAICRGADYLR